MVLLPLLPLLLLHHHHHLLFSRSYYCCCCCGLTNSNAQLSKLNPLERNAPCCFKYIATSSIARTPDRKIVFKKG